MRGNQNAQEFARIVIFGAKVDLSSYKLRSVSDETNLMFPIRSSP